MQLKTFYQLGKFKPGTKKPRPLFVKFLRSSDTANILRNIAQLSSPVYIKPNLTHEERIQESILLKKCRSWIDKGVNQNKSNYETGAFTLMISHTVKL